MINVDINMQRNPAAQIARPLFIMQPILHPLPMPATALEELSAPPNRFPYRTREPDLCDVSQMSATNIHHMTAEYMTIRMMYEKMNKRFRYYHKNMEKCLSYFGKSGADQITETMAAIRQQQEDGFEQVKRPTVQELAKQFKAVQHRYSQGYQFLKFGMTEQRKILMQLKHRLAFIREGLQTEGIKRELWEMKRMDKMVCEYLLHAGYIRAGAALVVEAELQNLVDPEPFVVAFNICSEITSGANTKGLREWCEDNRSKLRRINSQLEMKACLFDCIQMVKNGRDKEAVEYVRKFMATAEIGQEGIPPEFKDVLTLACLGAGNVTKPHLKELLGDKQLKMLARAFYQTFRQVYSVPTTTLFAAALQVGIAVHKTPSCRPDKEARCLSCKPKVFRIGKGLPYAHCDNSRILCCVTKEVLKESMYVLPSGYIYGAAAIQDLQQEDDMVKCAKTGNIYRLDQVRRIFVL